jgi:hypothetical protein
MPLLSAVGTNNYIWFNALFAASFWIAATLAVISVALAEHARCLVRGLAIAYAALIAFIAVDGTWADPYRQSPLSADTVAVSLPGPLSGLQVDPSTARFLREIQVAVLADTGTLPPNLVAWAGTPGADVAGGVTQPIFAWVVQGTTPASLALRASCKDQARGVLLLKLPGGPEPRRGSRVLPSQCADRAWIKQPDIDVPGSAGLGTTSLELFYSPPVDRPAGIVRVPNEKQVSAPN